MATPVHCADSQASKDRITDFEAGASASKTMSSQGDFSSSQPPYGGGAGDSPSNYRDLSTLYKDNPGPFDDLHKKCGDVLPVCFEGIKAMLQKSMNSHFQVNHTMSMNPMQSGYRLGVTYIGSKQISPNESYPVLLGDMDLEGNTSATMMHQVGDRLKYKIQAQTQGGKLGVFQSQAEWRGRLWTTGVTLVNPDMVSGSGVGVLSLLRRLTPRLDVGLELMYQCGAQLPGGRISALTYAARYSGDSFVAAASIGGYGMAHLSYYHHKPDSNLQMGVELETHLQMQESVATIGYQIEMPESNAVLRASLSSKLDAKAVLEKKLAPLPFTLALSGMLNHEKGAAKIGIGLIIG